MPPETHSTRRKGPIPARARPRLAAHAIWGLTLVLGVASAGVGVGCRSAKGRSQEGTDPVASAAPELPSLTVRDDSTGLTFSYITLDGGFQLVKRPADVPYEARDAVRVWSEVSGDGVAGPFVYVADLRTKLGDGTYRVDVVARSYFDTLAEQRRAKGKAGAGPLAPKPGEAGKPAAGANKTGTKVIIYGADWCKPCHQAEAYLDSKGVAYVHKDIDDPENNEEMRLKLSAAGMKAGNIPVLDVGGKLLVGFSRPELDAALAAAGG